MSFIFFLGGGGVLSSSIAKRKAPYTLQQSCTWYLVHMIAVCSVVVGRMSAMLRYVLLDRCKDARKSFRSLSDRLQLLMLYERPSFKNRCHVSQMPV